MVTTRKMKAQLKMTQKHSSVYKIRKCTIRLERLSAQQILSATQTEVAVNTPKQKKSEQSHNLVPAQKQPQKTTKIICKQGRSSMVAQSTARYSSSLWNEAKKNRIEMPLINSIVLAKMRTYSPWPAKIVKILPSKKKALVYFFGTDNHGEVATDEIVPFVEVALLIKQLASMKIRLYKKAVREAEIFQGVPIECSLLNDIA